MRTQRKNTLLFDIFVIISSVIILLLGMNLVKMITTSVYASFVNLAPMCLVILYVIKGLHFNRIVGQKAILAFFAFIIFLTFFSLIYGILFVFNNGSGAISTHPEHTWVYNNVLTISKFSLDDFLNDSLSDLYLGKYQNLLTYLSLMIRYGGDIPTNICIWNAFHLSLSAILITMIAWKMGVRERSRLSFIMFLCLLQPIMDSLSSFHRDGFGEAFLLFGLYIYICTYNKNISNYLAFPVYAFLLWSFRAQYIIIAVVLFFWSIFMGKKHFLNVLFGIIITIIVIAYLTSIGNFYDYLYNDMYIGGYEDATERQGRGIINIIFIGIMGYFPWTNLLRDVVWPYHVFACFQGGMNVAVLYYVIRSYGKQLRSFVTNPVLLAALMLFISALYVPGHMSYTMVSMPLFSATLLNVNLKKFLKTYTIICVVICTAGVVYSALGLTGTGAFR